MNNCEYLWIIVNNCENHKYLHWATIRNQYKYWETNNYNINDDKFDHFNVNLLRLPGELKKIYNWVTLHPLVETFLDDVTKTYLNKCFYNQKHNKIKWNTTKEIT